MSATKTFQFGATLVNVTLTRGFLRFFQRTTVVTCRDPERNMIEDVSWGIVLPRVKVSQITWPRE